MSKSLQITRRSAFLGSALAAAVFPAAAKAAQAPSAAAVPYKHQFKSRLVKLSDATFEIYEAGSGPTTFVCTHPYLDSFGPYPSGGLTEALANAGRTIYVCPRGTGRSSPEHRREMLTMTQLVDDMEELRKALGIEKWVPAGASTGGITVLQYGVRYPKSTAGLLPICTAATYHWVDDPACMFNSTNPIYQKVEALNKADPSGKLAEAYSLDMSTYNKAVIPRLESWLKDSKERSSVDIEELLGRKWDIVDQLKIIEVPTLVVAGRFDLESGTLKPSFLIVDNIKSSEYAIMNHSGHFPYDEEFESFNRVVTEFTRRRLDPHA